MKHLFRTLLAGLALGLAALPALHAESGNPPAEGKRAHRGPDLERMKEKLGLTDEQVAKLKTIFAEEREKMQALRDKEGSREDKMAEFQKLREATKARVDAVLTPEQKAKMDELRERAPKKRKGPPSGGEEQ